jgi:hypothetical protein
MVSIIKWWRRCKSKVDKQYRPRFDGIVIYFWWNIWKERNRRNFDQLSLQTEAVAYLVKEEILQFCIANSFPAPLPNLPPS